MVDLPLTPHRRRSGAIRGQRGTAQRPHFPLVDLTNRDRSGADVRLGLIPGSPRLTEKRGHDGDSGECLDIVASA